MAFDNDSEQQIFNAQVSTFYQQIPANLLPAVLISTLVTITIWEPQSRAGLSLWLAANYLFFLLRLFSFQRFNRTEIRDTLSIKAWADMAFFQLLLYGIIWALLPLCFPTMENTPTSTLLAVYFFATTAIIGLSISHSSFKPMWFAFVIPASCALIYRLISSSIDGSNMLAVYLLLFNLFLFSMMNRHHKSFRETTLLQTEYAKLMTKLQREKEKSDKANINKSTFLASASHDLRQPVHAMNLFIEMLQKQSLPADITLLISRIASSANNLQSLFNSLLDISRLDAGTVDINKKTMDLRSAVDELITLHLPEIEDKGLSISNAINERYIYSDPILVNRILSNLLINAIHYTDSGSLEIGSQATADDRIQVSITDTGKGIAPEHLETIFEEFKQLHNPERDRNKGLGLGLAICNRLAHLLDTAIEVESTLGQGSCFSLALEKDHSGIETAPTAIKPRTMDLQPYSIMIIDDEKDILDAMPMLLSSWGCGEVAAVADDIEALQAMDQGFFPDLVISDYRLRDHLTGLDVIEAISQRIGYPVRAVLITGDTAVDSLKKVSDSGLKVLHKPIKTAELEQAIMEALL
ncbi:hybrid sensor histidine kinase/response regulator [Oceanicoccus sagamiensis]|uniref:histidine kinase n=1 Tax=Oceanicoccus sagamiensis TaxID=716816 RepID=A0A1X9NFC1_9GAMM|nr:HAMP domain-containing sensor histidine kinase [Oceanicoccus sagamiensis]ARN75132.1 hypothetical protein BST96_14010 [Oceanicoccus sagamiensis]